MPADLPADVSYIAGVWCEGVLYGIHLVVFGFVCKMFCSQVSAMGRGYSSIRILLAFSFCMFTLSTAHAGLAVQSIFQGFIYNKTQDSNTFFHNNVFPKRKAIYIVNTLLADTLLIWRVFVIWQREWKIFTFPLILLTGFAVCGIKTIVANALAHQSSVFDPTILSWVTSAFVLNIATQITATSLIAFRIYRALNFTSPKFQVRYMSLIWLIVESGAVYTLAAVIQLITYLLKMNAGVIVEFMLAQICAITPNLIVIRVALGFTSENKAAITEDVVLSTFHNTYETPPTTNYTQEEESLDTPGLHIPVGKVLSHELNSRTRPCRRPSIIQNTSV